MKCGMFPGQEAAVRQHRARIQALSVRRASRRAWLGVAVGLVLGVFLAMLPSSFALPANAAPLRAGRGAVATWAHRVATGSLDDLLQAQSEFLDAFRGADPLDPTLALGAIRLAHAAVERDPRVAPTTTRALVQIAGDVRLGEPVRPWVRLIERGTSE